LTPAFGGIIIAYPIMVATVSNGRASLLFRAFADPTRLRILLLLRDGELCVGDIMHVLRLPQAKTSRHLRYLKSAGLVKDRECGPWSFYSLAPAAGPLPRRLLGCLDASAAEIPEIASDARRAAAVRRGGGCCPR
jgi:ArsR family transcriptional regulator